MVVEGTRWQKQEEAGAPTAKQCCVLASSNTNTTPLRYPARPWRLSCWRMGSKSCALPSSHAAPTDPHFSLHTTKSQGKEGRKGETPERSLPVGQERIPVSRRVL